MVITAVGECVQLWIPAGAHEVATQAGCLTSGDLSPTLIRELAKPWVHARCAAKPPRQGMAVQIIGPADGPPAAWWDTEFRWLLADPRSPVPWRRSGGVLAGRVPCATEADARTEFDRLCDPGFRSGVEAAAPDRTEDPAAILLGALDATEGALREAQRGLAAIVQAFLAAHAQTLAVLTPEVAAVVATRVSYLLTRLDRRVFCLRDGCHRPSTLTVMRPGKQAGIYFVHVSVRGDRPGPHRWDPSTQGFELELVEHAPDDAGR